MRLARIARIKGEGAIGMLVIVALLLAGGVWWLYSSRGDAEKNARIFASEVTKRIAVNYDEKYLHVHLSPAGQITYLRSWRDRLLDHLRELGTPAQPIELQGDVEFSHYFFDPHATFHAQLKYPTTKAQMELGISRAMTVWQVDTLNMTWDPVPTPTPGPTPVTTPTPAPDPKRKSRR